MSNGTTDPELLAALQRFDKTPWEAAYCAHQDSFELFTLTVRQQARDELEQMLPELGSMPFSEVNRLIVVVGFGAVREGARSLASLARPNRPEELAPVGYDPLWKALTDLANPANRTLTELRQTLESLPFADDVIASAERALRERLIVKVPELQAAQDQLRHVLVTNLLHGLRCEFLYPRLA